MKGSPQSSCLWKLYKMLADTEVTEKFEKLQFVLFLYWAFLVKRQRKLVYGKKYKKYDQFWEEIYLKLPLFYWFCVDVILCPYLWNKHISISPLLLLSAVYFVTKIADVYIFMVFLSTDWVEGWRENARL